MKTLTSSASPLPRRRFARLLVLLSLAAICLTAAPAPAQDLLKQVPSLKWIPADAGSYSAMLRGREQLDAIAKSKAWARINSMPGVQLGWLELDKQWNDANGPLAPLKTWYKQPGSAQIVSLLGELFSEEVFTYSSRDSADFGLLIQESYNAGQWAPLTALAKNPQGLNNDPFMTYRFMLQHLNDNAKRLRIPDQVIGFRLSKTKPETVEGMLEGARQLVNQQLPPILQGRLKKIKLQGKDVFTLVLDGGMIPWEQVPVNKIEEVPGQYDNLIKHIKGMRLTVAVTVKDNYVLMSIGEGTAGLQALGQGKRLVDRPEFAPLRKFADRKLTDITYLSKETQTVASGGSGQLDMKNTLKTVEGILKDLDLPDDKQAKIKKDLKALLTDIERFTPVPGAHLSFNFLTGRGFEGYSYDWTKNHGLESSKPLTILNHVGGQPLTFAASRSGDSAEGYEAVVKWIKVGHQYFEEFAVPKMQEKEQAEYRKFMKQAMPLLARLDRATGRMLLPSLDGQGAFVLDAKQHIKVPFAEKSVPAPEPAIVLGLRDAALFRQAMREYRDIFNETAAIIAKLNPGDAMDVKMPEPKIKKVKSGTLYVFPIPEVPGLDKKIVPVAGISDTVAVFAASEDHAARLLTRTPAKHLDGPLGNPKKGLADAAYLNWAGLVDAAAPWVNAAFIENGAPNDVIEHAQIVMEVLKVLRTYSSATCIENGAVVTHSESIFRDLEK